MKDPLRSKITVILIATLAFAGGLGVASGLDLTPETRAAELQSAAIQIGASADQAQRLSGVSFQQGFAPIVDEISGAVVTISVEKPVADPHRNLPIPFPRRREDPGEPRLQEGSGSGFIISEEGHIVTNNHVVEGAEEITIQLADRRRIEDVQVVGRDPQTDVALLKIEADDLGTVPLGSSDDLQVGEWVLAIGSPGFESAGGRTMLESTITAGIVSAKGRSIGILGQGLAIEDFIQTDAVINRGNSGGPLVNMNGEVVGMNTAIMSETGTYQGYGFAVPTGLIRQVVDDLMEYGEVRRAVLGITIEGVSAADARLFGLEEVRGVKVNDFSELTAGGSPAREAGLQRGDIILGVDGDDIQDVGDLQTKIRAYDPGETVTLGIARREGGETRRLEVDVELGAAQTDEASEQAMDEGPEPRNPLGIEVEPATPEIRSQLELPDDVSGVIITDHSGRRSALMRAAGTIPRGTLVSGIGGMDVTDMESYREAVSALEPGELVRVQLFYGAPQAHTYRFVTVEVPENGQ